MAISKETAQLYLQEFTAKFGPSHLDLARHLAFPSVLTPDMAYQIWAHFQRDTAGQPLNIPWVAVADILLSVLCEEIGDELYAMADPVRSQLLAELGEDGRFKKEAQGHSRLEELAHFLQAYVQKQLRSADQQERAIAERQQMQSLSVLAPEQVLQSLVQQFTRTGMNRGEVRRLTAQVNSLHETAALQLPAIEEDQQAQDWNALGQYAQQRKALTERKVDLARLASELDHAPKIGGVQLPGTAELIDLERLQSAVEPIPAQKMGQDRPWQQQQPQQKIDLGQFEDFESVAQEAAEETATAEPKQINRVALYQTLDERLAFSEVKNLIFDLGIDFDNLAGEIKRAKIRALILHCERQNKLTELLDILREDRPDIDQDELFAPEEPVNKSGESLDIDMTRLSEILNEQFNFEEIEELCFLLNIDAEQLRQRTKSVFIEDLLAEVERNGRVGELVHLVDLKISLRIAQQMSSYFTLDEIKTLCFDLGIDYDQLRGNTPDHKLRDLIFACKKFDMFEELVQLCRDFYPHVTWSMYNIDIIKNKVLTLESVKNIIDLLNSDSSLSSHEDIFRLGSIYDRHIELRPLAFDRNVIFYLIATQERNSPSSFKNIRQLNHIVIIIDLAGHTTLPKVIKHCKQRSLDAHISILSDSVDQNKKQFLSLREQELESIVNVFSTGVSEIRRLFPEATFHFFLAAPGSLLLMLGASLGNVHSNAIYHFDRDSNQYLLVGKTGPNLKK